MEERAARIAAWLLFLVPFEATSIDRTQPSLRDLLSNHFNFHDPPFYRPNIGRRSTPYILPLNERIAQESAPFPKTMRDSLGRHWLIIRSFLLPVAISQSLKKSRAQPDRVHWATTETSIVSFVSLQEKEKERERENKKNREREKEREWKRIKGNACEK